MQESAQQTSKLNQEREARFLKNKNEQAALLAKAQADLAAVEARGFLFATPMALELGVGVIPVRKPGKLPAETIEHEYDLEYGRDKLQMHTGILKRGARVLVVDDVLATGGTAEACMRLIEAAGGTVAGASFLVEISPLDGRKRLKPHRVESGIIY